MSRKNSVDKKQTVAMVAKQLHQKLGQLEIKNHDLQPNEKFIKELPDLIQDCYDLHQQLENYIIEKQKKHIQISSQEINMLNDYHKRIDYQEEHLFEYIRKHGAKNKKDAEIKYNQMLQEFKLEKQKSLEFKNKFYDQIINPPKFQSQVYEEYEINLLKSDSMKFEELKQEKQKQIKLQQKENEDSSDDDQQYQKQKQKMINQKSQDDIQQIEGYQYQNIDSDILEQDRLQHIQKLAKDSHYLKSIQKDLNIELQESDKKVDQLVDNSKKTLETSQKVTEETMKAYQVAQQNRKIKLKAFFMSLFGLVGFGACGPVGAAVGAGGGTLIGTGVGRLTTDNNNHTDIQGHYHSNKIDQLSIGSEQKKNIDNNNKFQDLIITNDKIQNNNKNKENYEQN